MDKSIGLTGSAATGSLSPVELSQFQLLTPDNFATLTKSLPRAMRQILGFAVDIHRGTLAISLPGGERFRVEGSVKDPIADLEITDYAFLASVAKHGDIGIAESFFDEHWTSTDVTRFLELFCYNEHIIHERINGSWAARLIMRLRHLLNTNTKRQAKRNISAHYDLGNAFYEAWLDPSMTYSSALFQTGANDLQSAQTSKYAALADATGIQPGDHVLEIGCGWGAFAEFLAKERGAFVTGLTISNEQFNYATTRIEDAGLTDQVDIKFQDYREEMGLYDAIVSVEMFEAVGEKFWPAYYQTLKKCLKEGGRAGLQIITIQEQFFQHYKRATDFIQQYIFPGGMLPTPTHLRELGDTVDLQLTGERIFGHDYARTLEEWRDRFMSRWDQIAPMGFDDRFQRMWRYYLHYCEAGFRAENIDVRQLVFAHNDSGKGPATSVL
ncbi:MAG: cyclopropane-fatty-acyl-phospholipid synthase family protein [Pseudomonadota bacterium]